MSLLKEKYYDVVSKPERNRVVGKSFISSYGKLPVHHEKYNKLVQYLEKLNKKLEVQYPSKKQMGLQKTIETQLNLSRLKILDSNLLRSEYTDKYADNLLALLSFRNWCGPGTSIYTNIKNDLDDPSRMFKIDTICRDHDIRYLKATTQEELRKADTDMLWEVFQKYIFDFEHNFITGNFETDFSNWSSSFNTVYNYLVSGIESASTLGLVGAGISNIKEVYKKAPDVIPAITKYVKYKYRQYTTKNKLVDPLQKALLGLYKPSYQKRILTMHSIPSIKTVLLKGGGLLMTTLIRDKLLALTTFGLMGLKVAFEGLFGYNIIEPSEHEVSEKEINDLIRIFELLQNAYLEDSDLEPIKIGDEWLNEKIIIPSVPDLTKDINEIVIMDKELINKKYELFKDEPEPIEPDDEETKKANAFYNDIIHNTDKIVNLMYKHNVVQYKEKEEKEEIELQSEINKYKQLYEKHETPDLQKDIKENMNKNIPEEEEKEEVVEEEVINEPKLETTKYKDEL
jgi:hypothetical protein